MPELDAQAAYFNSYISPLRSGETIFEAPPKTFALYRLDKLGERPGSELENIHPRSAAQDFTLSGNAIISLGRLMTTGTNDSFAFGGWLANSSAAWGSDYYFMLVDAGQAAPDGIGALFAVSCQNEHSNYAKVTRNADGALQLHAYDKSAPSGRTAALPNNLGLSGVQLFRLRVKPPQKRLELTHVDSGTTVGVELSVLTWSGAVGLSVGTAFRGLQGADNQRTQRGADTFGKVTCIGALAVAAYNPDEWNIDVREILQAGLILPTLTLAAQTGVAFIGGAGLSLDADLKGLEGELLWTLEGEGELISLGARAVYTPPASGGAQKARVTVTLRGTTYTQWVDIDVQASTTSGLRALNDHTVDWNFNINDYPADIRPYLERVKACVEAEENVAVPSGYPKDPGESPTLCAASMLKERVGRNLGYYIETLDFINRLTGAPWAFTESVRLLGIMKPRLTDWHPRADDALDGYKNFRYNYAALVKNKVVITPAYGATGATSNNDKNAKELLLVWSKIAHMTFIVKENARNQEERDLAAWWLDILLNHAEPMMKSKAQNEASQFDGNKDHPQYDPYKFVTVDRVMHPYLRSAEYCAWMYRMTGEQRYKDVIALRLPRALANFTYAPDITGDGDDAMIWCYGLRGIDGITISNPSASHMSVYVGMVDAALMNIFLEGYGDKKDDWMRKLSHGIATAFMRDSPYRISWGKTNATRDVYKTLLGSFYRVKSTADVPRSSKTLNGLVSTGDGWVIVNGHKFSENGVSSFNESWYKSAGYPALVPLGLVFAWAKESDNRLIDKYIGKQGSFRGKVAGEYANGVGAEAFSRLWKSQGRTL